MQPHHLAHRAGEQAERVGVAQVCFDGERQPGEILQPGEVLGVKADRLEALAVERHVFEGSPHHGAEARQLQFAHLRRRHIVGCARRMEAARVVFPGRDHVRNFLARADARRLGTPRERAACTTALPVVMWKADCSIRACNGIINRVLVQQQFIADSPESVYRLVREQLVPHYSALSRCRSLAELHAHPLYRRLEPVIAGVLATPEGGDFSRTPAAARRRYRLLAWNIERGIQLDGQLEAFRAHGYLRECDLLLLTETDIGMARSGNRAVAQAIARELGFYYGFAPCYLSLVKGSGLEYHVDGENELGLHGNAVLSRYPISRLRLIPLENGIDKMKGREKRIGRQTALAADIEFPGLPVTAISMHLDANSTQAHRRDQMREVLAAAGSERPVVLGGDWNTSTYNSSHAFWAILGFWLRVMMGVDRVIRNHYLHPYSRFEKELFGELQAQGFDFRACNVLGEYTGYYDICDPKARASLGEWVPRWCFAFIRWALRNHGGRCPLKLDWFATRGLRCEAPVVVHGLNLSDHDPIGVDLLV